MISMLENYQDFIRYTQNGIVNLGADSKLDSRYWEVTYSYKLITSDIRIIGTFSG